MVNVQIKARPVPSGGWVTALTFAATTVTPMRVRDRAPIRASEYAHHLAALAGRAVTVTSLPPTHLPAPARARDAAFELTGAHVTSLRSLLRAALAAGSSAPTDLQELVHRARARGLVYVDARDGQGTRVAPDDPENVEHIWLGSVGSLRTVARYVPNAILVNGHYFTITPPEQPSPHGALGDPVGLHASNGVLHTAATSPRAALLRTRNGWKVRIVGLDDVATTLPCMPASVTPVTRYARTPRHPTRVRTPRSEGVLDVAIVDRTVVGMHPSGGASIPPTGFVLRFGERLPDETRSAVERGVPVRHTVLGFEDEDVLAAVQGGPLLVDHGRVVDVGAALVAENFAPTETPASPVPSVFPADADVTRAARLAVGVRADGSLVVVAVQGRSSRDFDVPEEDRGATLLDMAALLVEEGAVHGLNLDGGGSVQAFAGSGSVIEGADRRTHAHARYDRPVPTGLAFT
ncbi:MAG: phosphodiester glycosidase family protein [Trueperaceae bacterium]|nr:phosphodiester glycosidase family protein [Trueperaceae bacterium]